MQPSDAPGWFVALVIAGVLPTLAVLALWSSDGAIVAVAALVLGIAVNVVVIRLFLRSVVRRGDDI